MPDRLSRSEQQIFKISTFIVLSVALLGTLRDEDNDQHTAARLTARRIHITSSSPDIGLNASQDIWNPVFYTGRLSDNPSPTREIVRRVAPEIIIEQFIFRILEKVERQEEVTIEQAYRLIEGRLEVDTDFSAMTKDLTGLEGFTIELLSENLFPEESGEIVRIYLDTSGVVYYVEFHTGQVIELSEAIKIDRSIILQDVDKIEVFQNAQNVRFEDLQELTIGKGKLRSTGKLIQMLASFFPRKELVKAYQAKGLISGCVLRFSDNSYFLIVELSPDSDKRH